MLQSNCYIVGSAGGEACTGGGGAVADDAVVIDPGVDTREVSQILKANKLILKYIILTHAHIDHIEQVNELQNACGCRVVIHEKDAPLLMNDRLNGSLMFGSNKRFREADILVKDGDTLDVGSIRLEFIHTPGHTPGSMCIKAGSCCIFTGDTLFRCGVGRTDLGAGDSRQLAKSLSRLMELPDELTVYPGHGPSTSIGNERKNLGY